MMAPKIGPRGITIQDVQDVVNSGLPKQGAATYASSYSNPTATTPVDYAALLAGGPAPTYGLKYGGQPSGEYAKQMILGAAMQAKSIGDLAALQAATNQQNLTSKFASDLTAGTNKMFPSYQAKFAQPLVSPSTMQSNIYAQNITSAVTDLQTQLAAKELQATRYGPYEAEHKGINKQIADLRAELAHTRQLRDQVNPFVHSPEQLTAENKQNAYGAYMDRMNMLDLTKPGTQLGTYTNLGSTNEYGKIEGSPRTTQGYLSPLYQGAQRQVATNLTPGLESAIAQQVTPYENVAAGFANTPLSEFAQQIAVNRYGYDPALAAGLFDTSVDVNSLKDQADYFAAQHPEFNMSPIEIVFNQLGQDGVDQYLQQQAQQALYGTPSQQTTAAQTAQDAANAPIDAQLYSAYATAPGDVGSALNADVARQYMSDPNFLAQFQAGTTKIYDDMSQGLSGAEAVNSYMQNYLDETGDPVSARILEELLSNISFG
jgi:hypothetical protein